METILYIIAFLVFLSYAGLALSTLLGIGFFFGVLWAIVLIVLTIAWITSDKKWAIGIITSFVYLLTIFFMLTRALWYPIVFAPDKIIFSGKTVDPESSKWTNNRLIIVFLNGEEIGRAITKRGEFSNSRTGINDGLYVVETDNTYRLKLGDMNIENIPFSSGFKHDFYSWDGGYSFMYHWFDPTYEGTTTTVYVPVKNANYVIYAFHGDISELPPELLIVGVTHLREDGAVIVDFEKVAQSQNISVSDDVQATVNNVAYNSDLQTIDVNRINIPINNCQGSSRISQKYIQTQTYMHEYRVEAQAGVSVDIPLALWLKVVPELSLRYGFSQGQIDTTTVEYDLIAEPGQYINYFITWQEEWGTGTVDLSENNQRILVPYRVKMNLTYKIESQAQSCP